MATTGDDRGSGVVGPEEIERYEVEGVTYEVHPAARLFPRLKGKQFDELFYDIAMNGLREPVVVRSLEIVDRQERQEPDRQACSPSAECSGSDSKDPGGGQAAGSRHVRGPGSVGALAKFGDCRCAQWEAGVLGSRRDPLSARSAEGRTPRSRQHRSGPLLVGDGAEGSAGHRLVLY